MQFRRILGRIKRDATLFMQGLVWTAQDFRGLEVRRCTVCNYTGRFRPFGRPYRIDALCPRCDSLERHRLLAQYAQKDRLFSGRKVLHFAPEPCLAEFIRSQGPDTYLASHFGDPSTLNLNLESIDLEDSCLDIVVASHVLEHVDDRRALPELRRILKPEGLLVLMVPIAEGWSTTYENPSVHEKRQRRLHFGQTDHVRYYGSDFRGRVVDAGFELSEYTAVEPEVSLNGLLRGEKLFLARPVPL
jgi:SAM-dependent methyltransferase